MLQQFTLLDDLLYDVNIRSNTTSISLKGMIKNIYVLLIFILQLTLNKRLYLSIYFSYSFITYRKY